ncbi:hypothetical protein GJAV_G00048670 [Gymnothorax javanicus]|nr:hypothetical protein GJAV_G00048670 [Gymnothorax javanicus]
MRVFGLILLLFFVVSNEAFTVRGPAMPLVVQVGASVTLPCSADTPLPLSELQVQWMKEDSGTVVHLFQEGESRPKSQSASYRGRAEFFPEEISKGNFSLLLVNVTTEDKGLYKCVVRTENESNETVVEINIERLVVTGAVKPVFAYTGEDVILNCTVDTHVPVGQLQVQWIKIDGEILVLLFDEGESRPESQDERFRGRAEFFSEEIPKGNFSMKLRDIRTEEDKGEFMCRVDGGNKESVNATAWLRELGFSSLHLLVLVFAISSAVVALSINICALWCIMTEDQSNRSCLCCLHDSIPCILIAIAFAVWGAIENSFVEGFVCGAVNFLRILLIFKMAPYKKFISGTCSWRLANLALPLEYVVIATGANSDVLHRTLKHQDPNTAGKALVGCFFGGIVLCGLLAVYASGSSSGHHSRRIRRTVTTEATTQALKIHWIVLYFLLISSGCAVIFLTWTHVAGVIAVVLIVLAVFCLFGAGLQYLCRSCLSRKKYRRICLNFLHMFIFIILIATVFSLLDLIFEKDKERPVWMCLFAFLFILTAAAPIQQGSNYPAALQIPVYVFGSVVLSAVNSAALASEVIFKSEKGERTTGDLRLIVLPFESVFLACWFGLQLYAYWGQEKEEIKHQLRLIGQCCKKGQSSTSPGQNQEAVQMESLSEPAESTTHR